MQIEAYLGMMKDKGASDLYLKVGSPVVMRIDGHLIRMSEDLLMDREMEEAVQAILNEHQWHVFSERPDMDFAYTLPAGIRFRINLFRQQGHIGLVARLISGSELKFKDLNLPFVLQDIAELPRGLVIVTGATGSGKSTTLAAMIHHINANYSRHIMTVEDPVEFLHSDIRSLVNQREVGYDTCSFKDALRQVVRQSPDVILIGEMRDTDTMVTALSAAQTGHLVLTTLHTVDVAHTLDRIINYFPDYLQKQIRVELSECLQAIICMRLLRRHNQAGRIPAMEIMRTTSSIKKALLEGEFWRLKELIQNGTETGMQTFNQSLLQLYKSKQISFEEALMASSNPEEFKLNAQGMFTGTDSIRISKNLG
ncbi:MAG: PilT/PilU family type 4a pilus ATPase [bacterium]|jgi:twitching motility protein PilT|nr:PilT/PilU family type 4a pilus ATPase [bacterium]